MTFTLLPFVLGFDGPKLLDLAEHFSVRILCIFFVAKLLYDLKYPSVCLTETSYSLLMLYYEHQEP